MEPDPGSARLRRAAAVTLAVGAVLVLVLAIGNDGADDELDDAELSRFQSLAAQVQHLCKDAIPGRALDQRLQRPVDALVELAAQEPDRIYDPDPRNDPEVSDETSPALELQYLAGLLDGREVTPPRLCSRRHASRLEREIRRIR